MDCHTICGKRNESNAAIDAFLEMETVLSRCAEDSDPAFQKPQGTQLSTIGMVKEKNSKLEDAVYKKVIEDASFVPTQGPDPAS